MRPQITTSSMLVSTSFPGTSRDITTAATIVNGEETRLASPDPAPPRSRDRWLRWRVGSALQAQCTEALVYCVIRRSARCDSAVTAGTLDSACDAVLIYSGSASEISVWPTFRREAALRHFEMLGAAGGSAGEISVHYCIVIHYWLRCGASIASHHAEQFLPFVFVRHIDDSRHYTHHGARYYRHHDRVSVTAPPAAIGTVSFDLLDFADTSLRHRTAGRFRHHRLAAAFDVAIVNVVPMPVMRLVAFTVDSNTFGSNVPVVAPVTASTSIVDLHFRIIPMRPVYGGCAQCRLTSLAAAPFRSAFPARARRRLRKVAGAMHRKSAAGR